MQPDVGKGAKKYPLTSKQAFTVGYPRLTPPTKKIDKKSNAVQGISHGLATLYRSQGCIYSWNLGHHNGRREIMHHNGVLPCLAR